uniref:Uncharacterized protein n=1 Tax=Arundo donax TaxID=35708 RepID=A0A0A9ATA2_ARUDO
MSLSQCLEELLCINFTECPSGSIIFFAPPKCVHIFRPNKEHSFNFALNILW